MLEWAEKEYPDSALFLYFKSRILRLQVSTFVIHIVHADCSECLTVDIFAGRSTVIRAKSRAEDNIVDDLQKQ